VAQHRVPHAASITGAPEQSRFSNPRFSEKLGKVTEKLNLIGHARDLIAGPIARYQKRGPMPSGPDALLSRSAVAAAAAAVPPLGGMRTAPPHRPPLRPAPARPLAVLMLR
jgi:hypothetical protein